MFIQTDAFKTIDIPNQKKVDKTPIVETGIFRSNYGIKILITLIKTS